jgi:phosphotriesterase-related protein
MWMADQSPSCAFPRHAEQLISADRPSALWTWRVGCGPAPWRRTGVPISTHTHAATRRGLEQQRIFAEEGVDLARVIIGHCGDTTDIGYLEELIANGSYLGMDRFGLDAILPFEDRVNTVARRCERGHADKMVLSHDAACYIDAPPEATPPDWHHLHIHHDVIPALKARGVTDDQITTMLVDNPCKIFHTQGGY